MNINLKFLLLGTSLSLIPNLLYAQCAVTDCQQLGYTSLQKCDNGLKCPFGEYWACPKVEEKAVLGECTGYAKNCKIGDILNSDGTCTNDKENSKTPLGVVVAIKDNCGYAMTASPIRTSIRWSTEYISTDSFQSSYWLNAIKDFNVSGNMTKIIQAGSSSEYPAAYTALNYAPSAAIATKNKWALPTAGILNSLYTNLSAVNNAISKLNGTQLIDDNEHIWSSSEFSSDDMWVFCTGNGNNRGGIYNNGKHYNLSNNVVRPVLAF